MVAPGAVTESLPRGARVMIESASADRPPVAAPNTDPLVGGGRTEVTGAESAGGPGRGTGGSTEALLMIVARTPPATSPPATSPAMSQFRAPRPPRQAATVLARFAS